MARSKRPWLSVRLSGSHNLPTELSREEEFIMVKSNFCNAVHTVFDFKASSCPKKKQNLLNTS